AACQRLLRGDQGQGAGPLRADPRHAAQHAVVSAPPGEDAGADRRVPAQGLRPGRPVSAHGRETVEGPRNDRGPSRFVPATAPAAGHPAVLPLEQPVPDATVSQERRVTQPPARRRARLRPTAGSWRKQRSARPAMPVIETRTDRGWTAGLPGWFAE